MLVHFDVLNDMTAVYCRPSYEISRADVKFQARNPSQAVLHFPTDKSPRKLAHISDADILNGVRLAISHLPNEIVVSDGDGEDSTPLIFKAIKLDFIQTEELWKHPYVEMRQTRAMFSPVAAQMAKYRLFQPDKSLIDGKSILQEDRLQVSSVSFVIMEVIFVALVVITLSLFFIAPGMLRLGIQGLLVDLHFLLREARISHLNSVELAI